MYQCTSVESAKSQAPHNHFTRSATVASPEARGIPAQLVFTFLSVYQFFHQKQPRLFPCLCTYKSQRLADSLAFAPRLDFLFSAARRFPGIISTVTEFLVAPPTTSSSLLSLGRLGPAQTFPHRVVQLRFSHSQRITCANCLLLFS
jgi:hypothetical protein